MIHHRLAERLALFLSFAFAAAAGGAGLTPWHPSHPKNELQSFDLEQIVSISKRVWAINDAFAKGDFDLGERLIVDYYSPPPVGEDVNREDFVHFGFTGKFVTFHVPSDRAVRVLKEVEDKCAKHHGSYFVDYIQLWTIESYMLSGDYTNAIKSIRSFTVNGCRSRTVENAVFGVSGILLGEKMADLALAVCTNAFGDLRHPRLFFNATNSSAYSHLAGVKQSLGDDVGALDILVSFQTNEPSAFNARYAVNGKQIISLCYTAERPFTAAVFLSTTVESLKSGRLKIDSTDNEYFMKLAGDMQKAGWLDGSFRAVDRELERKKDAKGASLRQKLMGAVMATAVLSPLMVWLFLKSRRHMASIS